MRLRTERIETWIDVDGDSPEEMASFLVRPLTPKEITQLLDKATETEWDKGQRFKEANFYKYKVAKINKTILNWKGVEDENGNPIECNATNRELVYLNNPEFIDKILELADALYKGVKESQEKEAKNLQTAQPGMAT